MLGSFICPERQQVEFTWDLSLSLWAMLQEFEGLAVHNASSPLVCSLDADVCQDLLKPI